MPVSCHFWGCKALLHSIKWRYIKYHAFFFVYYCHCNSCKVSSGSHWNNHTLAGQCRSAVKDQLCKSMREPQDWPLGMPKPLNWSSPNTAYTITSCKISSRSLKGFLVSIYVKMCRLLFNPLTLYVCPSGKT